VRSTDLLSLPNVNPEAGFGMQLSIEDTIESNFACFQAALLYTSSKGGAFRLLNADLAMTIIPLLPLPCLVYSIYVFHRLTIFY